MKTLILSSLIGVTACVGGGDGGTGGGGGGSAELPLIVPPVRAAAPSSFQAAAHAARRPAAADGELSATEFRDRFFNPAGGPTDVFQILAGIDARLAEINTAGADKAPPCLDQAPVAYTLSVFGQDIPFAAQCYRRFGAAAPGVPAAFMQFGKRDGVSYLFVTGGAARVAARVTPVAGTTDVKVDAWYGVGYTNASCGSDGTFDGCSYAVTEIHADPTSHAFEMAVAGIGVGFCGISMRSDGASIHGAGSIDMGQTCRDQATLCVSASDLTATGACDAIASFTVPALGRKAGAGAHVFGASGYPATPNITLDGTATDSLGFGPATAPTDGVGDFDAR
ncbi:MAG TPA: hypothetical protein VK607_15875 [Kofleriaceae bacterium]|nr:hypothetical protein [Kofleriaceae bacterium]